MLGKADSEWVKLGRAVIAGGVDVLYGVEDIAEDAVEFAEEALEDRPL